ncbi:MAG: hypothetical protein IBX39_04615 [Candidatus Methanoperedenaceae archaeon]|nr:hypothetical protein [Candidatus Methanoperedenaceae archaeon]
MIRSEKAVSEVIGMVMILFIMMIVIGAILLVGVPMIESGKERARMDVAANSFLSLQNDIEEVVRGPIWVTDPMDVTDVNRLGPSRETGFQLMGGTLSVLPKANTYMILDVTFTSSIQNYIIGAGEITFEANGEEIGYENGALIRKYEGGEPLMFSNPLISIYNTLDNQANPSDSNITISIHAINLSGNLSSVGGDGKARIETRPENYKQIIPPDIIPGVTQLNISIYSARDNINAWESFFNTKLETAGLDQNCLLKTGYCIDKTSTSNLVVRIYGNNNTRPDIFLSVYESTLNVMVR